MAGIKVIKVLCDQVGVVVFGFFHWQYFSVEKRGWGVSLLSVTFLSAIIFPMKNDYIAIFSRRCCQFTRFTSSHSHPPNNCYYEVHSCINILCLLYFMYFPRMYCYSIQCIIIRKLFVWFFVFVCFLFVLCCFMLFLFFCFVLFFVCLFVCLFLKSNCI